MSTSGYHPSPEWVRFVSLIAELTRVPADLITPDARLVQDLAFDSLALSELGVSLREAYETREQPLLFDGRNWATTTVKQLFEDCTGLVRTAR